MQRQQGRPAAGCRSFDAIHECIFSDHRSGRGSCGLLDKGTPCLDPAIDLKNAESVRPSAHADGEAGAIRKNYPLQPGGLPLSCAGFNSGLSPTRVACASDKQLQEGALAANIGPIPKRPFSSPDLILSGVTAGFGPFSGFIR
ncbi:MAG: hypothetical protein R6X05_09790 [Desulfobacterales bacterium]